MDLLTPSLFIPACFALNLSPGPNNILAMSTATRFGMRTSLLAATGRLLAFSIMIALASFGLATVLYASELFFQLIKYAGAAYLFYLAWKLWTAPVNSSTVSNEHDSSVWTLGKQEFLVAAGNPKAILIFTAFFPQFIEPGLPVATQFLMLGGMFLLLEWIAVATYAFAGTHLSGFFGKPENQRYFNRGSGALLCMAGVGLLVSGRSD